MKGHKGKHKVNVRKVGAFAAKTVRKLTTKNINGGGSCAHKNNIGMYRVQES